MGKTRLEAFSDGVLAIIITIMVLELKVPHGDSWAALLPLVPVAISYLVSFVYVAIYWNNHHHLLHTCNHVSAKVLWANLHLLFWLSLLPFSTGWLGENHFAALPTMLYGIVLLMCGAAYYTLQLAIIATQGPNSILKRALGWDWKGKLSVVVYLIAITVAQWQPWLAQMIYVGVALLWVIPDRRIERALRAEQGH